MRFIGYFLLVLLGLIIILSFIKIKVELFLNQQDGWIELRYLWLKYRLEMTDFLKDSTKEKVESQFARVQEETKQELTRVEFKETVKVKKEPIVDPSPSMPKKEMGGTRKKRRKKTRAVKIKQKKVTRKLDMRAIKSMIRRGKTIFKLSRKVLIRLTNRIRIHRLESMIDFSLDDAMTTGCIIGALWTFQANFYAFIERYVKKVDHYHFDVKSKFKGNSLFISLSCILSFRIVDIILVLLLSFKELLTIKRMLKIEEE